MVFGAAINSVGRRFRKRRCRCHCRRLAYRCVCYCGDTIWSRRPRCRWLKTDSSLPLTNGRVYDHGNGLTPHYGPRFRCTRPHRCSEASSFSVRTFSSVTRAPASWWEEVLEASYWQEICRWRSCHRKHVPDFPSILLESVPWWRWKYVVAVVAFLVF